jgi:hypothetical protein
MRTGYGLVGLVLCIVGVGSASASNYDNREQENPAHAVAPDHGSTYDNGGHDNGDAPGLPHGRTPQSSSDGPGNSVDHTDSPAQTPITSDRRSHPGRSHLGWQSLLPGSIQ